LPDAGVASEYMLITPQYILTVCTVRGCYWQRMHIRKRWNISIIRWKISSKIYF